MITGGKCLGDRIGGEIFSAVIESSQQVVGFVGNGGNYCFVTGGGIQHHKGFVVFYLIAFVNGFSKSGKVAVGCKRFGFADINGGIFGVCRAFRYKNNVAIRIFCIQFRNDVGDAVRRQQGIPHFHMFK